MLERFVAIGRWLHRFRRLLVVGIFVGVAVFAASLAGLGAKHSETSTMLPVLLVSWCLVGLLFAQGFHMGVPEMPVGGALGERIFARIKRALFTLLGLALVIVAIGSAVLTLRALGIILREVGLR